MNRQANLTYMSVAAGGKGTEGRVFTPPPGSKFWRERPPEFVIAMSIF